MEGAGISGFQGLLLWEETGFAALAWQRECQEQQELFPASPGAAALDVCWCLWITGAWEDDPSEVHASLPVLAHSGHTARGLGTVGWGQSGDICTPVLPMPRGESGFHLC